MSPLQEALAVVSTGALHLLFEEVLHRKLLYLLLAGAFWTAYVARAVWRDPQRLRVWGLRCDNLAAASRAPAVFSAAAAAVLAAQAAVRGTLVFHWHMLPLLALYPVWGLIQQLLIQALVVGNLARGVPALRSPWLLTPIGALLFGLVHWPDPLLMAATCALGCAFTPMYLRAPNLWPLGVAHGWLGVLAYFWLLGRDPWVELFAAPVPAG